MNNPRLFWINLKFEILFGLFIPLISIPSISISYWVNGLSLLLFIIYFIWVYSTKTDEIMLHSITFRCYGLCVILLIYLTSIINLYKKISLIFFIEVICLTIGYYICFILALLFRDDWISSKNHETLDLFLWGLILLGAFELYRVV